jgi:hypothetical protein
MRDDVEHAALPLFVEYQIFRVSLHTLPAINGACNACRSSEAEAFAAEAEFPVQKGGRTPAIQPLAPHHTQADLDAQQQSEQSASVSTADAPSGCPEDAPPASPQSRHLRHLVRKCATRVDAGLQSHHDAVADCVDRMRLRELVNSLRVPRDGEDVPLRGHDVDQPGQRLRPGLNNMRVSRSWDMTLPERSGGEPDAVCAVAQAAHGSGEAGGDSQRGQRAFRQSDVQRSAVRLQLAGLRRRGDMSS